MEERDGTVVLGVDYYSMLIENNAVMQAKIDALERMLKSENSIMVSAKRVGAIFGFNGEADKFEWVHKNAGYQE